jgi:hypothetical protein
MDLFGGTKPKGSTLILSCGLSDLIMFERSFSLIYIFRHFSKLAIILMSVQVEGAKLSLTVPITRTSDTLFGTVNGMPEGFHLLLW